MTVNDPFAGLPVVPSFTVTSQVLVGIEHIDARDRAERASPLDWAFLHDHLLSAQAGQDLIRRGRSDQAQVGAPASG
jgi:hypothetical protein